MSTFNTRKDRDRNGKAKPHKHSGIPTLTGKWRHPSMDCWVNYSTPGDHEWKRLYTTLRRRADDRRQCHRVMQGDDPEGIVWFPDCYPPSLYCCCWQFPTCFPMVSTSTGCWETA